MHGEILHGSCPQASELQECTAQDLGIVLRRASGSMLSLDSVFRLFPSNMPIRSRTAISSRKNSRGKNQAMQKNWMVGIRSYSKINHVRPPSRIYLVGTKAVLLLLYCRLKKGLLHSHCYLPRIMSRPRGPLHMRIRCLMQFGR